MLGKPDLNMCDMREVFMQNAEPASTRKAIDILVKFIDGTYAKKYLKQVANNSTHLNAEERT